MGDFHSRTDLRRRYPQIDESTLTGFLQDLISLSKTKRSGQTPLTVGPDTGGSGLMTSVKELTESYLLEILENPG